MLKKAGFLVGMICWISYVQSQEIQARLTVMAGQISTQVNKSVFQTLQTSLTNFINTRKWTSDAFQPAEKIQCNFLLNVEQELGNNIYRGRLTVQAARPVHSTTYDSPIINFLDDDIVFRYQEFQPIEFNENRIQGNDPVAANLPAVLAYYVNIILGFDYGSFSLRGGDAYFKKAWNIVNNAPESRDITGWKSFENIRNRYWLAENLNNNRFALLHDALYSYYRSGLDLFYENENEGRNGVLSSLNLLNTLNTENPNSMIMQFFFQGKSSELVKVFSRANNDIRTRAKDILTRIDISNTAVYKELK
ncbi:MAG: type IX secretion system protein PorD [Chitinophagaceae bacterium]